MKRAERDEWVAALRSGDYIQGHGTLNKDGRQCCLGVKCELDLAAGRHGVTRAMYVESTRSYVYNGQLGFPTEEVVASWGMTTQAVNQLASLNDTGSNFNSIAGWIEENVEVEE